MKMIVVTLVDQNREEVLKIFKDAGVEHFSGHDIAGYRENGEPLMIQSWFPSQKGGTDSELFFAFIQAEQVTLLFGKLAEFNRSKGGEHPVHAVEIPVERFL